MVAAVVTEGVETKKVKLCDIVANSAQSRGMGVLSNLQAQGYGLFEKASLDVDKDPIWGLLMSEAPEDRKRATALLEEHEPGLVSLANKLHTTGQLQPIGVRPEGDGYDVIFGMRRTIATAYNFAKHGDKATDAIEAKVFRGKMSLVNLKLMALEENDEREEEGPIDKALTFKWLQDEGGLDAKKIAHKIGKSDQYVREYMKLLHKLLEDKRLLINTRVVSVQRALKLLKKRQEANKADAEDGREHSAPAGTNRFRLPGTKGLIRIYEMPRKPDNMEQEEWDLYTDPQVRKFLAYKLGLKYAPYKEPPPEKKGKGGAKVSSNGDGRPKGKVLKVSREFANKLLISLGMTNARAWKDDTAREKLENIVNNIEDGQRAETEQLNKFLDKLIEGYKDGVQVEFK